jgi:2-oxoglutarate ferredoxin oxidoreductase subunit delta
MAKGRVIIDQEKCKGCNICVVVCPVKCLQLDETKVNKKGYNPAEQHEDTCIGCTSCAVMCPDSCIEVLRETDNG